MVGPEASSGRGRQFRQLPPLSCVNAAENRGAPVEDRSTLDLSYLVMSTLVHQRGCLRTGCRPGSPVSTPRRLGAGNFSPSVDSSGSGSRSYLARTRGTTSVETTIWRGGPLAPARRSQIRRAAWRPSSTASYATTVTGGDRSGASSKSSKPTQRRRSRPTGECASARRR